MCVWCLASEIEGMRGGWYGRAKGVKSKECQPALRGGAWNSGPRRVVSNGELATRGPKLTRLTAYGGGDEIS